MLLINWEDLDEKIKNEKVKPYYDRLKKRQGGLIIKRMFDVVASVILLVLLSWLFAIIAVVIKLDSKGEVIYKQIRVTQYGRKFYIYKFRTMKVEQKSEELNRQLTVGEDSRITKCGAVLRKFRLDEIPQLVNVLKGDMSFVGTRPEVPKYVDAYTPEMMATLLLPAGVTGIASIQYKEESEELAEAEDPTAYYINEILPKKMELNLKEIREFSVINDFKTMINTVAAVLK